MPSRLFVTLILTLLDVSTGEAICAVSLADGYGVKAASKHIPNHLIEQGSVRCSVFGVVEVEGQRGIVGWPKVAWKISYINSGTTVHLGNVTVT